MSFDKEELKPSGGGLSRFIFLTMGSIILWLIWKPYMIILTQC